MNEKVMHYLIAMHKHMTYHGIIDETLNRHILMKIHKCAESNLTVRFSDFCFTI